MVLKLILFCLNPLKSLRKEPWWKIERWGYFIALNFGLTRYAIFGNKENFLANFCLLSHDCVTSIDDVGTSGKSVWALGVWVRIVRIDGYSLLDSVQAVQRMNQQWLVYAGALWMALLWQPSRYMSHVHTRTRKLANQTDRQTWSLRLLHSQPYLLILTAFITM